MTITKADLRESIHQLLRAWLKTDPPELAPLVHLRLALRPDHPSANRITTLRQILYQALKILQSRDDLAATLLQQRYLADTSTQEMTRRLSVSESQYYKLQNEAVGQLAEIVWEQEEYLQAEHRRAVEARLPPLSYQRLFGVSQEQERLRLAVERPTPPWLIAVDGIGGGGKTALADNLVREMVPSNRFVDIAWVSAQQQNFTPAVGLQPINQPALDVTTLTEALLKQLAPTTSPGLSPQAQANTLADLLKKAPYLVVIDNLETTADYQALLPTLHQWADPSKFLLTSRYSLYHYPNVFCISLKELNQADTLALLIHEAEIRGLPTLVAASESQLGRIYKVVGGNPLALKLVVGQICTLPLSQVLSNLKQAKSKKIEELYTYIYRQSWQALTEEGRRLLLAMPFTAGQGSDFTHLAAVSGLAPPELSQALEELIALSLVEVGGDIEQRRYRIHRLTETFLLTEIAKWPPSIT